MFVGKPVDQGGTLRRLVVTGLNGAGKSHMAGRLAAVRPDVPCIHFDRIKLTHGWQQRPRDEIDRTLADAAARPSWIIEGGPTVLPGTLHRADAVVWLDPPEWVRAWRLFTRPWKNFGRSRPELPDGNVDWPLEQYRFALQSLRWGRAPRVSVTGHLHDAEGVAVLHCRSAADVEEAVALWARQGRSRAEHPE